MDEADKLAEEILAKCIALDWGDKSESFLAERIRDYGEACRRAGAEAMREAAADEAHNQISDPDGDHGLAAIADDTAAAIRKLSLPSAEAASPAAGWRPIGTAPKDGTEIDVWLEGPTGDGHRVVDAKHDGDRWVVFSEQWDEDVAVERNKCRVTHWLPLPAAPLPAPSEEARAG